MKRSIWRSSSATSNRGRPLTGCRGIGPAEQLLRLVRQRLESPWLQRIDLAKHLPGIIAGRIGDRGRCADLHLRPQQRLDQISGYRAHAPSPSPRIAHSSQTARSGRICRHRSAPAYAARRRKRRYRTLRPFGSVRASTPDGHIWARNRCHIVWCNRRRRL